jgi:Uma2 family endonuclease
MSREITLPEAKPALEWVNGRALQKVSTKRKHAIAQGRFFAALDAWAQKRRAGIAGTEWRFRIRPPGEDRRPLVPDVAFLSYSRLPFETQQLTDEPLIAPDAVVEVLSPDDRRVDIEEKLRVYLAAGTSVVFLVDPDCQIVRICDAHGERIVSKNSMLTHEILPGFRLAVHNLFSIPKPR